MTTGEEPNDIHGLNIEEDKEYIEEIRDRIAGKGHHRRNYPRIDVGDMVKVLRKPGKFGEFKIGFVAWTKETYRVERIEYQEGSPLFYLAGRDFDKRAYRLHEILKVEASDKPPALRAAAEVEEGPFIRRRMRRNKPLQAEEEEESAPHTAKLRRLRPAAHLPYRLQQDNDCDNLDDVMLSLLFPRSAGDTTRRCTRTSSYLIVI